MPAPPPTFQRFLDTQKDASTPTLKISFPSGTNIISPGETVQKASAKASPKLHLSSSATTKNPGTKYLAISLDLDAPFPSFPLASPIIHYMHVDLEPALQADSDGWVELQGREGLIASWAPPAPPPISAKHRYVFLIWEMPEGTSSEKVRKELGVKEGKGLSLTGRVRWDFEPFKAKLGLGDAVAGGWFCV